MISYRIDVSAVHAHHFEVTLTIPAPAPDQQFSLPVWIPGSYMVREFSRHLSALEARQGDQAVPLRQLSKNTWRAECRGRAALVLRYRVYAFDNSVRAAYLDAHRGFFNATSLCLQVQGRAQETHRIELCGMPQGWRVATAMASVGRHRYEAADYDELVDHPFELGAFWSGSFEAGGARHELVVAGALPAFDGDRLLRDTQRLCEAQMAFWHGALPTEGGLEGLPFKRYVFLLNAVDDGYGGLEHRASTALIASRRDLPRLGQAETSDGYVRLLGLISHEYFHTWNVKRLRPTEFERYDYEVENYTELLWFFEGFTSYYDDLFLLRTGLIDAPRYLKLIGSSFSSVLGGPGHRQQSLAQSSFEAWTKYYRPDENTPNAVVSYYAKGAMLALALDASLRVEHGVRQGLDALMRRLWLRSAGGPVSEADILDEVRRLADATLAEQLQQWVHSTDELPLQALLAQLGVSWTVDKPTLAQRLGLRVSEGASALVVKQVMQGSAAMQAGFSAGDEILACNDWRLKRLDDALLTLGDTPSLRMYWLLARDQRVLRLSLDLPDQPAASGVVLRLESRVAATVLRRRKAWLAC